jgi:hypothetical protein
MKITGRRGDLDLCTYAGGEESGDRGKGRGLSGGGGGAIQTPGIPNICFAHSQQRFRRGWNAILA